MNFSGLLLKIAGWKVQATAPDFKKCIICVAPHTSNWDFIIGKLAYSSIGRNAGFLIKDTWFVFPFNLIFKAMGGIPVPRKKKSNASMVDILVKRFNKSDTLQIAITPEGTRSPNAKWKTGFLQIAHQAHVPCLLAAIDFKDKIAVIDKVVWPTGQIEEDMRKIKDYYKDFKGKHPENFIID